VRALTLSVTASALLAITALTPAAIRAETAVEPTVTCIALSGAVAAKLIPSCTALIDDPATLEAERLDAIITRAVALYNSGQTGKALAEIDAVVARDPQRARAFRARGEIFRQAGKAEAAFAALNSRANTGRRSPTMTSDPPRSRSCADLYQPGGCRSQARPQRGGAAGRDLGDPD
jgi:hypothetical protein